MSTSIGQFLAPYQPVSPSALQSILNGPLPGAFPVCPLTPPSAMPLPYLAPSMPSAGTGLNYLA